MSCADDSRHKREERAIIEWSTHRCEDFPAGLLDIKDRPDGRIPDARLGIEVTQLLPLPARARELSGTELSARQEKTMEKAQYFFSKMGGPSVAVRAYFNNEWARKHPRSVDEDARRVALFVRDHCPPHSGDAFVAYREDGLRNWPEPLCNIVIERREGSWDAPGCGGVPWITKEQLADRIRDKNQKLAEYRKRLPGWRIWLLIATNMSVLRSVSVPREVTTWRFAYDFDKVYLSSWEDGVLDLRREA